MIVNVIVKHIREMVHESEEGETAMPIPEKVKRQLVNTPVACEFVKVMRDCPHNVRIQQYAAKGSDLGGPFSPAKALRGLLYDYDVVINGVKLGRFERIYNGKGYYLENLKGDRYHYAGSPTVRKIDAQSVFMKFALEAHAAGFFITPRAADVHKRKEARKREQARKRLHADAVKRAVQANGTQMYNTLRFIISLIDKEEHSLPARIDAIRDAATNRIRIVEAALPKMGDMN